MEPDSARFALGRLVLDYIRTFTWPALLLLAVVFYKEDVLSILREREVNIFGVQIGPRVQEIKQQTQAELQDIKALVAELRAAAEGAGDAADGPPPSETVESPRPAPPPSEVNALAKDIETKIVTLQSNLDREIQQIQQIPEIQQQMPRRRPEAQTSPEAEQTIREAATRRNAASLERRGFSALLDRDVDSAARAFAEAQELWPDYHNVSEINNLLQDWRSRLESADSPAWPRLYRVIVAKYSWGMPSELRDAFRREASQARK